MAVDLPLCYHGAISRRDCEELMGKKNKDGAYLIRDSETIQGAMCLCIYKKHVVYTYRLLKTLSGQYTLVTSGGEEELFFKSLDELILHYKRKNQGLVMHLRHSIKRKTALLIRNTPQIQNPGPPAQGPEQRPERRPERRPAQGPEDTRDQRRPSRPELNPSPRGAEERRDSARTGEYSHPRPVQPAEREEVEYENLPEYVDVEPS